MTQRLLKPSLSSGRDLSSDRVRFPVSLWAILALAGGTLVAARPELPAWEYLSGPEGGVALAAAVIVGSTVWRWPWLAPVLLTVFVFSNLSQALVRQYQLPSVLQPLILVLVLITVGRYPRARWRRLASLALTIGLTLVTLMTFGSSLWAIDPKLSDMRSIESLKSLMIYGLLALTATTGTLIVRSAWAMVTTASILAGLGIFQVFSGRYDLLFFGLARVKDAHIFGSVFEPRISGPLGDPNFFAQVLLVALPIAAVMAWSEKRRSVRVAGLVCAATIGGAIVFTYSRGAIIALAGQILVAVLFHRRRGRMLMAGAAVAFVSILLLPSEYTSRLTTVKQLLPGQSEEVHPDSSFEERRLFTRTAWEMFLDHPVKGVGAGNYSAHFDEYASRVGTPLRSYDDPHRPHFPHSLYLEIAAEGGVLGLSVFLLVICVAGVSLSRSRSIFLRAGRQRLAGLALAFQVSLAGYLISSLFLHGHFQRYLWLILGFCAALTMLADSTRSESVLAVTDAGRNSRQRAGLA